AERWASSRPVDAPVPTLLHIPSAGHVKGTEHVDAAAGRLQDAGALRYVRMQGIPAADMPGLIGNADMVVDQLLVGSYGVAACEALAAGRVVVGNVDAAVRDLIRSETGLDVPIVQADPDTIEDVLRGLAADPERRQEIAAAGPVYVRQVHSGALTAQVLGGFLGPESE
ncbi:MAG TPA: glycosyltransferase, partial [Microbacterium sp.]|nr:glycosyltransferase [Microbacterium sp.]